MSEPINDGGPAFPQGNPEMCIPGQGVKETQGMSLRDWFAGQFLTTVVINGAVAAEEVASACYRMADAMLKARAAK